ncbi:MAG: anti-sigma factor [Fluviicola sp.]|nr:anti-sigma factor [Fluviicola sp.]
MVYTLSVVDVKAYIESGILESYVLGFASEQEVQEVRCLSHIYPEIAEELKLVQEGIEKMATQQAVQPPVELKNTIMAAIKKEAQIPSSKPQIKQEAKIVSMQSTAAVNPWKWGVAASLVLLFGVGALWVNTRIDNGAIKEQLAQLDKQKQQDNQVLTAMLVEQERLQEIQKVLTEPSTKTIVLNGTTMEPNAEVHVMWSSNDNKAVMVAEKIAPPPPNMQYQLWVIADGVPKSVGVFTYDELDNMTEPFEVMTTDFTAFAITLEKMGGSPTPTLEKMVVMGELASL